MAHRRLAQATVGLTLLLALAVSLALPSTASAATSISQARATALRLQGEIAALNSQMAVVASRYDATAQRLDTVDAQIAANQRRLDVARYELALAHKNLAARVVAMYKAPASGFLDVALSAASFNELVSSLRLWDGVFRQGALAVSAVERSKAAVQQQGVHLAGERKQAAAARQAAATADTQPISGAAGDYSPSSWAQALLRYLGMPVTSQNLTAITAWELAEGGNWFNSARYNPLDTTMPEPGATVMNSVGVKAYTSWAEGFTATVATLHNGLYGAILTALQNGNDAVAVAAAVAASPWNTGAFGV